MPIMEPLAGSIEIFDKVTSHPENYLSVQDDLVEPIKTLTKIIYDFSKKEEQKLPNETALPELIVNDFDEEQIWQEIELQNEDRWTHLLESVSKLLTSKNDLQIPVKFPTSNEINNGDDNISQNEEEEMQIEEYTPKESRKTKKSSNLKLKPKKMEKGSIVDDEFFKLKEMEEFLEYQDKAEMMKDKKSKKKNKEESSDEEDEEEVDLFNNWESDGDDEEMDTEKNPKYKDFFDGEDENDSNEFDDDMNENGVGSNEETDSEIDLNDDGKEKKVRFNLSQPSSDDDDNEEDDDGENSDEKMETEEVGNKTENLSEFQLRQERLKKKIGHLENNLFEEKHWPMKGEIDAASRPQNSLLEEVVDFDMTSRPAPVITEETTFKLQDIIIQRIKDKSWDDVVRKLKPVQEVQEFKKQLVLDQEKSKLSLAQVYEQDYIKQREALDPDAEDKPEEIPEEHLEIKKLMSSLFSKLDALCNFHYTPKIAAPEVKIVSNMPAITMEEVAPVASSEATLLAPEEVKRKPKGDIIGKTERTDTDKKRERRKKKIQQREKEKEKQKREKLVDKLRPGLGNKYSREKVTKLLEKVTKDRNVDKMDESIEKKSFKSSSSFFTQLQDEVSSAIKSKLKTSKSKGKKNLSAKQVKL